MTNLLKMVRLLLSSLYFFEEGGSFNQSINRSIDRSIMMHSKDYTTAPQHFQIGHMILHQSLLRIWNLCKMLNIDILNSRIFGAYFNWIEGEASDEANITRSTRT